MKKIISLLFVCILITGCAKNFQIIDANKAMELIKNDDTIIIDVRSEEEFKREHISKAINIPLKDIGNIKYNKDKIIILYCNVGEKSKEAAKLLVKNGYTRIYSLDGGLLNWGFELEE